MTRAALFLDRDGVVNREVGYVWQPERFEILPQAIEMGRLAQQLGYPVVIVTNQAGVARGLYSEADVEALHTLVCAAFADAGLPHPDIWYCPHHPDFSGRCLCRKPEGLWFERALARGQYAPNRCWMVGDHERDLVVPKRLSFTTVFIGESTPAVADFTVPDVGAALELLRSHLAR